MSIEETIHHLAVFIARLWQIHVYSEGNTRTASVFFIKYVRTLGFDVENDSFAENAWYFRNALVGANYNDLKNGVHETTEYLELFLRNVLLDEKNELHNRTLESKNRTLISENFLEKKWKGLLFQCVLSEILRNYILHLETEWYLEERIL